MYRSEGKSTVNWKQATSPFWNTSVVEAESGAPGTSDAAVAVGDRSGDEFGDRRLPGGLVGGRGIRLSRGLSARCAVTAWLAAWIDRRRAGRGAFPSIAPVFSQVAKVCEDALTEFWKLSPVSVGAAVPKVSLEYCW